MKILHTSDLHLGKKLLHRDRLEEQIMVMDEIKSIANAEEVDLVLVAGDLFDNYSPSAAAQRLMYSSLQRLANDGKRPIICIAGNHDSPERIESVEALADVSGIFLLGYTNSKTDNSIPHSHIKITKTDEGFMELTLPHISYPIRIIHTPFANHDRMKTFVDLDSPEAQLRTELQKKWQSLCDQYCNSDGVNILMSHLFVTNGKDDTSISEPDDENPIMAGGASAIYTENIPQEIQYTALGHLHRCFRLGTREIWYSGSPLEYSFAESEQDKFVLISNIEPNKKAETKKVALTTGYKLVCKTFDCPNEACQWLTDNPNVWVDLTIQTDEFLTAAQTKMINDSHKRIVTLRPLVKNTKSDTINGSNIAELIKDKDALFAKYFETINGQSPNEEIMNLFHEILAQ